MRLNGIMRLTVTVLAMTFCIVSGQNTHAQTSDTTHVYVEHCGRYQWHGAYYENDTVVSYATGNIVEILHLTLVDNYDTVTATPCLSYGEVFTYAFIARDGDGIHNDYAFFTESGTYTEDTNGVELYSTSYNSCVTHHTLILSINRPEQRFRPDIVDTSACDSYRLRFCGQIYMYDTSADTTIVRSFRGYELCYDSLMTLHLTIRHSTYLEDTVYDPITCDTSRYVQMNDNTYHWRHNRYEINRVDYETLPTLNEEQCPIYQPHLQNFGYYPMVEITGDTVIPAGGNTTFEATSEEYYLYAGFGYDFLGVHYQWYLNDTTAEPLSSTFSATIEANPNGGYDTLLLFAIDTVGCMSRYSIPLHSLTNGILSPKALSALNLYPNPAVNSVTITTDSEISGVTIYNSIGKLVLSKTTTDKTIDVTNLGIGIYTLVANTNENNALIGTFIIQR